MTNWDDQVGREFGAPRFAPSPQGARRGAHRLHLLSVIAPADVLAPVDPWRVGRWLWQGRLPYRDFAFEYPPGAVLAFLLPGAVPQSLGAAVLALQAVAAEMAVVLLVLRRFEGALWRWVPLSLMVFPFLAGGFDALPMAAIAASTALLATGASTGWWVAALGTLVKLSPGGAWVWGRPGRVAVAALAVTIPLLLVPAALARHSDDPYIGYTLHRGVQVESVAASTAWAGRGLIGRDHCLGRPGAHREGLHVRLPVQILRD